MRKYIVNIGDVFATILDNDRVKCFQFIAIDENQMRSEVIRVFSTAYKDVDEIDISKVVNDSVDFYAHCVVKAGLKYGYWKKIGTSPDLGKLDVMFRSSRDF